MSSQGDLTFVLAHLLAYKPTISGAVAHANSLARGRIAFRTGSDVDESSNDPAISREIMRLTGVMVR
jgi:hypothetical protein